MTNEPSSDRPFSPANAGSLRGLSGLPSKPTHALASGQTPAMSVRERLIKADREIKNKAFSQAADTLKPLLKKKKADPGAYHLMSVICQSQRKVAAAIDFAKKANTGKPNDMSKLIIASSYRSLGKTNECIQWADKVLRVNPKEIQAISLKAGALEEAGRADEAEAILLPLIDQADGDLSKLPVPIRNVWACVLVQRKKYPQAIEIIDDVLEGALNEQSKVSLFHLKAKAHDRSKEYDQSWTAAENANAPGQLDYDSALHTEQVDMLMEIWSNEHMDQFPITTCDSVVPVFVAGMPRSGTSLIDQIIDAHPQAAGVGELSTIEKFAVQLSKNYCPDEEPSKRFGELGQEKWQQTAESYIKHIISVSPKGVERVVNKSLGNNKLVGLIARLFPKTRIIHAVRDPRDVAISCFMGGFNNKMHPWTSRVDWAAHAWGLSDRMMKHWKETLNIPILEVHYEKLVADPENEFPRLIEFLELDFDPACYDFHTSKRTVRTLSYDQVNRPLYTTSSGRHKNYEAHIKDVRFPAYTLD